ncbi:hypothetical protein [Escherichia coli]|uniref:hypothetical protein n=1 Tax=Escherichia coli TaxID=562 RepID=UPI00164F8F31|nr:hypothetical protein [Escherichia coli]EGI9629936.1 hypothetical protein [Escherichia coli]EGM8191141.1 hypothetical protein [Escherichia coli]
MLKKIVLGLLIVALVDFSFDFGRRWELSKTAEYCSSIGKKYLMLVPHIASKSNL